jgi:hypothetical protein
VNLAIIPGFWTLVRAMPLPTGFLLLLGLPSIGLPATNGFPVRLLLILEALEARTGTQPKGARGAEGPHLRPCLTALPTCAAGWHSCGPHSP